jgi:hypothetical protein
MSKAVTVDDDALHELMRAARWYERQRLGLGDELLDIIRGSSPSCPPLGTGRREPGPSFTYWLDSAISSEHGISANQDERPPGQKR